ncbi:CBS domain-containing protein [Cryomorpha ignava]|uniref:CBS domain-containing protein n=1 Tax=Cryomorpha ignava TaxID=101383 RepID=A0A7K3WLV7_9FLAO|nr:CBS domain-containing protein [Cryomorpha ignava]NEN22629.1 CBS domain-containing protein [Cryomorpha ignava]
MVKSFTGVRKAPPKKEIQQVQVCDYMTEKLTTFTPDQCIGHVVEVLLKKNISGGPVLDAAGNLVGIISEGDCLKEIAKGKYSNVPNNPGIVAHHMVRDVITIAPDVNILEAAQRFLELKVRRFPVIKNGQLIGQISQRDVLRAINNLEHETW